MHTTGRSAQGGRCFSDQGLPLVNFFEPLRHGITELGQQYSDGPFLYFSKPHVLYTLPPDSGVHTPAVHNVSRLSKKYLCFKDVATFNPMNVTTTRAINIYVTARNAVDAAFRGRFLQYSIPSATNVDKAVRPKRITNGHMKRSSLPWVAEHNPFEP